MDPYRDDQFVAVLESLRPAPSPEFAAALDERAAAGFPGQRRARSGSAAGWQRLVAWMSALEPRKLLLPAGGIALTALVVTTAVVAVGSGGGEAGSLEEPAGVVASQSNQPAGTLGDLRKFDEPARSGAAEETEVETFEGGSFSKSDSGAASASGSAATTGGAVETERLSRTHPSTGPYASGAKHRDVERAAEMTLGTEPSQVGDAAGKVYEVVHQYDGIVLDSSVRGGSEGGAGARFDLLIPSARLSDALAAFSGIAEVRARHESSNDITAPTVTVGELLQDSHARIESLLGQLANAETEAEQEAVEAKLRAERNRAANLKSQLTSLQRRANLSHVSLRIETDESATGGSGGGWDAGNALHDAGHILSVAAGVLIVAAAVLAPVALLVLIVLLTQRAWIRNRRERALD